MSDTPQFTAPPVASPDDTTHNPALDPSAEVNPLQAKVDELTAALKDTQARANAEMYNFQKRVERETDLAKKYAVEKFAKSMLDVVDNLERALAAATPDTPAVMLDGIALTYKNMLTELEKNGISVLNPQDEAFNAELHQAVGIAPDAAKDIVGVVLQKGYALHGRVLRPAMVQVGA